MTSPTGLRATRWVLAMIAVGGTLALPGISGASVEVAGPLSARQVSLPPPSSTTTSSSVPSSITTQLGEPRGRPRPVPVNEREHRPQPLWVGAVVGLSGLAGLALSRALRRPARPGR